MDLVQAAATYFAGYAFSIIGGAWGSRKVIATIPEGGEHYSTELLGIVETAIYTTAWIIEKELFIPVWLGLKVSTYWSKVSVREARPVFNRWLIGTGIALAYGVVGGVFVLNVQTQHFLTAYGLPVVLVVGTLLLALRGQVLKVRNEQDEPQQ